MSATGDDTDDRFRRRRMEVFAFLFLTVVLYPNFAWDEPGYHLEGDPEGRTFAEILVDVVATEVIEPWGGGKWHLEIFRSINPEPEDWNGEM